MPNVLLFFVVAGVLLGAAGKSFLHDLTTVNNARKQTRRDYWSQIRNNMQKLERWEAARPFIFRGHCPFARRLILETIEIYEYLLFHGYENDIEMLELLESMLDDFPPDYDPPDTGGSFLIEFAFICARIVGL